ncbi:IS630 family transposase [Synergistales bacterium]|nr:IS630 family transposase [Synergistales bacterium]
MYVDESGVNKFYQREYARAPIGQKTEDVRRGEKYRRTNVIAGYCNGEVLGSHCYLCNTNGDFFELWFEKFLLPEVPVGYTIVMDNASFHRKKKLQKLAEKYGIRLIFLPPYSPDLNPIEKLRANMKRALRDLVRKFRTLVDAIYEFLN